MKKWLLGAVAIFFLASSVMAGNQKVLNLLSRAKNQILKGETAKAVRSLELAVMELRQQLPLKITNVHLCDSIRGYGDFSPKPTNSFKQGEPLLLYFEVENPGVRKVGNKYGISLSEDARLLNEKGKVLFERKNWTTLRGLFPTPSIPVYFQNRITGIPRGRYVFEITINDMVKRTFVVKKYEFTVE